MEWILSNIGTILAAAVVLAVIGGALAVVIKNKKSGKGGCGCGCEGCALREQCRGQGKAQ